MYVAEELRARALEQIGTEQRAELLRGLKAKWDDLHQQFQGLSVVTDTAPKKNRKERMEAQMSQVSKRHSIKAFRPTAAAELLEWIARIA